MYRWVFMLLTVFVLASIHPSFAWHTYSSSDDTPSCRVGIDCESGIFGLTADEIAEHAKPDVEFVRVDQSIVFDRFIDESMVRSISTTHPMAISLARWTAVLTLSRS